MAKQRTRPIDAWLVRFAQKQYWNLSDAHMRCIKEIWQVSWMDRNVVTHCCEFEPSYWLEPVGMDYAEFVDGVDEETQENIQTILDDNRDYDGRYMHCRCIDKRLDACKRGDVYHYGETGVSYEDTSYEEQVESLREHFQGNAYL